MRLLLAGLNHELLELALDLGHEVVAAVDPAGKEPYWHDLPVYVSDEEAVSAGGFDAVAMAIDCPAARRRAFRFYADQGIAIASIIGGQLSAAARYGAGLVVQRLANISVDCILGEGVRLNVGANVMHDARVGDFVTIAPNAVILGHVSIGSLTYIGANATVLLGRTIGTGCMIGAGAVVVNEVADGVTVKGNPAR